MLVSEGYPEKYEKNKIITGLEKVDESIVFHAGTTTKNANILTNGGRVLAITSYAKTIDDAVAASIKNAEKISFEGKYYRRDIGSDL